jgi:hypothetical protein
MREDNTEPRDNQQIADDNQQSGNAGPRDVDENVANRGMEDDFDDEEGEEAVDEDDEEAG